jgi:site-specific recombinase XerD
MEQQTELFNSLTRYCNYLAARNVSANTAAAYRIDLTQFLTYVQENAISVVDHPSKISATHISDFLSSLSGQGRSGVTRARKLSAIREYLKYLVDIEKALPSSPAEKIIRPKKERKQRVFLRVDEYMRLLNAAAGNSRDYAILQLFIQTGIRVSELTALTLSDIDLDGAPCSSTARGKNSGRSTLRKKQCRHCGPTLPSGPQ